MNYRKFLVLGIFTLLVSVSFVFADDVLKAAPGCCKVLLENENVRVLDYVKKAGEKAGMHSHPNHVIYALTDGKMRFTMADGSTKDLELKAGESIFGPAGSHATENTGANEIHIIMVEIKK